MVYTIFKCGPVLFWLGHRPMFCRPPAPSRCAVLLLGGFIAWCCCRKTAADIVSKRNPAHITSADASVNSTKPAPNVPFKQYRDESDSDLGTVNSGGAVPPPVWVRDPAVLKEATI